MAHVVSGKLRKDPFIKQGVGQGGESDMFVIELAEVNKDYKTGEKSYTNYKAMFFAKTPGAKEFYGKAFANGSFVVVQSEKLKVDQFQADNGNTYITLVMENPRLESAMPVSDMGGAPQQPQQPAPQPQNQQAPQQKYSDMPDFDDDIPFN